MTQREAETKRGERKVVIEETAKDAVTNFRINIRRSEWRTCVRIEKTMRRMWRRRRRSRRRRRREKRGKVYS